MTRPITAALGCIVLAAAASAHAEDPVAAGAAADPAQADNAATSDKPRQELETLTVTTGSRSAKAVDKIPGAIVVVTRAEVDRTLALTDDATAVLARTVPGYAESSQAMSNT